MAFVRKNMTPRPAINNQDADRSPASFLDRLEKFLKISKSVLAVVAAIAALIVASQSEARHTRFTIYVMSRMWIELTLICSFWCAYLIMRKLLGSLKRDDVSPGWGEFRDRRLLGFAVVAVVISAMLLPPLVYVCYARYRFWTSQIIRSYAEEVREKVDDDIAQGKLDSALNKIIIARDNLTGTAQENRLNSRRSLLGVAIDRSMKLNLATTDEWNFVTQRDRFFALAESVRLNPENSDASDHLSQKLHALLNYLGTDASAICSSTQIPTTFSGKAVALIEARVLWNRHGTSTKCLDQVQSELYDGWGIEPISCLVKQNALIRQDVGHVQLDPRICPDGKDFWTPLPDFSDSSQESDHSSFGLYGTARHPDYPTFVSVWRIWQAHHPHEDNASVASNRDHAETSADSESSGSNDQSQTQASGSNDQSQTQASESNDRSQTQAQTQTQASGSNDQSETQATGANGLVHVSISMPKGGVNIDGLSGQPDWTLSSLMLDIPDAGFAYRFTLSNLFPTQKIQITSGSHSYYIRANIRFVGSRSELTGDCKGRAQISGESTVELRVTLKTGVGISDCSLH
jgi:hypothetical protein